MKEVDPNWWQHLFDEVYLITDARSIGDTMVTSAEVNLIIDLLQPGTTDRILDLCGGQGRHALELSDRGFKNITVIDYSYPLLFHGCKQALDKKCEICFCRSDARYLGIAASLFDLVLVMGNSFGYFMNDDENRSILSEIYRVLRPGGKLLLDLVSRDYIVNNFRPESWHEADSDIVVCRKRRLEGRGIIVREIVLSREKGLLRDITYFSRLFTESELVDLLTSNGFRNISVLGGFSPHQEKADYGMLTNRLVITAVSA